MSDVYLYFFVSRTGPESEAIRSTRPATLEAIKGKGEPVMESQIVVDHTEVDGEGFLITTDAGDSRAANDIATQIWSLELRAASRDSEASQSSDGVEKYKLSLESTLLRMQAGILKTRRAEVPAADVAYRGDMKLSPAGGYKQSKNGSPLKLWFADRRKRRDYSIE
jgi:hypothetical protein